MKDSRVAKAFFEIGIVLTLASMVLGPFDIIDWSISFCVIAILLAVFGLYFAFTSWNEPVENKSNSSEIPPKIEKKDTQSE